MEKIDPVQSFIESTESTRDLTKPVEIKEDLTSLASQYKPRVWNTELPIDDGTLMADRLYQNNDFRKFIAQEPALAEEISAAVKEGTLIGNLWETVVAQSFIPEEGFSSVEYEATERGKEIIKGYSLDDESLMWITEKASSPQHWEYLAERVAGIQRNRELLHRAGWSGIAWQLGAWLLDPINITGYGLMAKGMSAVRLANQTNRFKNFYKSGLLVGGTEMLLFAPVVENQPTLGTDDLILAGILGGTLGGGVNVYLNRALNNVAKSVNRINLEENGGRFVSSVTKNDPDIKKWHDTFGNFRKFAKDTDETVDELLDTSIVDNKSILFPTARNFPSFGIIEMTKSGAMAKSASNLVKAWTYKFLDDPIGWADDTIKGSKSERIISQPDTVEVVRDTVLMTVNNAVYPKVHEAFKAWTKQNGAWVLGRFMNYPKKLKWDMSVKRAIIALGRQSNGYPLSQAEAALLADTNILKAANAYADGFEWFANKLKQYGIEGTENIKMFRGYVPRKSSLDRLEDLSVRLGGEQYVEELIEKAILNQNKYDNFIDVGDSKAIIADKQRVAQSQKPLQDKLAKLNEKIKKLESSRPKKTGTKTFKTWNEKLIKAQNQAKALQKSIDNGETAGIKIDQTKARLMASAIIKMIKYSKRSGGFDLERLVAIKDPKEIRQWIDDMFYDDLTASAKLELEKSLSQNFDILTSGRFAEKIRMNENFETVINGQTVRLDELYNNSIDDLWTSYTNEMSGWLALAEKTGIKSRKELYNYKKALNDSIDEAYPNEKGIFKKADEEKKTIEAVFHNLFGRSAELDPTSNLSTGLRWLRRYNFTRVLNQVGIAQLPEFGVATAQQGFRTLFNEIPAIRNVINRDVQNLSDTFYKDMAIIGASNGDEWLYRMFSAYEMTERGVVNAAHYAKLKSGVAKNAEPVLDAMEKGTGFASGLLHIDSIQRKLAMRMFVHRFAEDLIDVGVKNIAKGRLNRYRVLGLSEDELTKLANEFTNNKNVVSYKNYLGRRVMNFHWENFSDQALVRKFAIATNRYTRRAVQYNMIGDTSRLFSDTAIGKTVSQFRQFIMVAWNKQFLHNLAMADFQSFTMAMYTMMLGGMAYYGQTHFNAIGMDRSAKKKYFAKRFGKTEDEFFIKMGLAAFQRAGWSSMIPPMADMITSKVAPQFRFNTRSSGTDMNILFGNPTVDLAEKFFTAIGNALKTTRSDYEFNKTDLNRIMRLFPFQNMYGFNQILNFIRDRSGLPDKGTNNPY